MKLTNPICPECKHRAIGTIDLIPGTALFDDVPFKNKHVDFCGETDVFWDGQKTITNDKDESQVTCDSGHTWFTKIV